MTNLRSATVTFFSFFTDSIPTITVIRLENEKSNKNETALFLINDFTK